MSHPDKSWRVGAIYRCCVRYNKDMLWAKAKMAELSTLSADGKVIAGRSYPRLVDIWFRRSHPSAPNHIEQQRHLYRLRKQHDQQKRVS